MIVLAPIFQRDMTVNLLASSGDHFHVIGLYLISQIEKNNSTSGFVEGALNMQ